MDGLGCGSLTFWTNKYREWAFFFKNNFHLYVQIAETRSSDTERFWKVGIFEDKLVKLTRPVRLPDGLPYKERGVAEWCVFFVCFFPGWSRNNENRSERQQRTHKIY